ncbi:DNA primase family protein [Sediminimonas qiaohouensis]|uniref:DNA primase family protein n=1 Tax=Sediminimonas qiaohouensis TaxID=552061 RepID=UPI000423C9FB|nr:phage/plasmid primase, P4 family [Sediminimonas qiaohouensis]
MSDRLDHLRDTVRAAEDVDMGPVSPAEDDGTTPPDPPDGDYPDGPDGPPEAKGALYPLNDIGNGQRFALYFGDDALRVPRVGWFVWTGRQWQRDDDSLAVRRLAHRVPEKITREIQHLAYEPWEQDFLAEEDDLRAQVAGIEDVKPSERTADQKATMTRLRGRLDTVSQIKSRFADRKKRHRAFALSTGNSNKLDHMLDEGGVSLSRHLDDLDADPIMINTATAVLSFNVIRDEGMSPVAEMTCLDHDRGLLLSKMMPVEFDPDATCPRFDAFLERVQPNSEIRGFIQRWFGLCMTSITGDQKLAFFYGHGANGKSVLVDLLARMLGDYAATAKIESLTGTNRRGGGDATPDLIPLMGARFVRASEPEQGTRLQEGVIKELTGGEPILVRALHSDFVEVKPEFKLTISGNHKPEIRGTDDGIWRRVLLTPFDVQIPQAERDPDLGEKLWAERAGILNWMIEGLRAYLEGGLQEPDAILDATAEYRRDSDPVGSFLTECAVVTGAEDDFMLSRDLIAAFNFWLDDKGETQWGGRTVSNALKNHAQRWRHPHTGRSFIPGKREATGYRGIRLTDTFERRFRDRGGAPGNSDSRPADQEDF